MLVKEFEVNGFNYLNLTTAMITAFFHLLNKKEVNIKLIGDDGTVTLRKKPNGWEKLEFSDKIIRGQIPGIFYSGDFKVGGTAFQNIFHCLHYFDGALKIISGKKRLFLWSEDGKLHLTVRVKP